MSKRVAIGILLIVAGFFIVGLAFAMTCALVVI